MSYVTTSTATVQTGQTRAGLTYKYILYMQLSYVRVQVNDRRDQTERVMLTGDSTDVDECGHGAKQRCVERGSCRLGSRACERS